MRTLFFLIAAIAFSSEAPAADPGQAYSKALALLAEGRTDEAYVKLDAVEPATPVFADALVELQKLHYRAQQWQKFFGFAQFYRKKLLATTPEQGREFYRQRMLALEVMALAKHCHWREARAVGYGAIELARGILGGAPHEELDQAMAHLELAGEFPAAIQGRVDGHRPNAVFSSELLWKIDSKSVRYLSHPRAVRVVVESRCESKLGQAK